MTELIIDINDADRRLDRFIMSRCPGIGIGKLNRLLRERGITVNKKKVTGGYRLEEGDTVRLYFDTSDGDQTAIDTSEYEKAYERLKNRIRIMLETGDVIVADKPAGVLSQKAAAGDPGVNEWLVGYLLATGVVTKESLKVFRPSICNRLDMNTSGLIICSRTLRGSRTLSSAIRDRRLKKFYHTLVHGGINEAAELEGYLVKDERTNTVKVSGHEEMTADAAKAADQGASQVKLSYRPLEVMKTGSGAMVTLLEVQLMTGKSHQIRAQLAAAGHPILFDPKYGDRELDGKLGELSDNNRSGRFQLLHCARLEFPSDMGLQGADGRVIESSAPWNSDVFYERKGLWRS